MNVQSVRNKILVDHIIEAIISHDLDILILTDTWLTTDDKDQFFIHALSIKGYKFYSFPRGNNTGHGGVGIIIRSSINIRSASQCDSTNFENCILSLDLKQQRVDLCAVYRPPPSDKNKFTANKFIDEFGDLLQSYASNSTPVAFLGDFNFHLDNGSDANANRFISLLHSLDFDQMRHHPPIALDIPMMQSYLIQDMVWCQMCMLVICSPITASSSALYHTLRYQDPGKQVAFTSGALLISQLSPAMLVTAWHWFQSPQSFKHIVIPPQQLWYTDELRAGKKSRRKSEQKWRDHRQHTDNTSDPNWAEYHCAKQSYNLALDQAKTLYYNDKM